MSKSFDIFEYKEQANKRCYLYVKSRRFAPKPPPFLTLVPKNVGSSTSNYKKSPAYVLPRFC